MDSIDFPETAEDAALVGSTRWSDQNTDEIGQAGGDIGGVLLAGNGKAIMLPQVEGAIDTVFNTKGGELTGTSQIGVDLSEDDQAVVRLSPTKLPVRPRTPRLRT